MNIFDEEEIRIDEKLDRSLRPSEFDDFIGQTELIKKLRISIEAAKERDEPLDHVLICGPPGLGKTTIARIIAESCEVGYKSVNGPTIQSIADILGLLTNLERNSILFIDEIHGIHKKLEEIIYLAMEDFIAHITLGNKQKYEKPINPFCLIGATTKPGRLSAPLRDRFGIFHTMQYYSDEDLTKILENNIHKLNVEIDSIDVLINIAKRSRGIPRVANRLLRRVRDYAQINNDGYITNDVVNESLFIEGIDELGLTPQDKKYLNTLYKVYNAGPAGLESISSAIGEDPKTVDDFIEPFLIRNGFITKHRSGRILSPRGMKYLDISK